MADDGVMSYFAKFGLDASEFLAGIRQSQSGVLAFYRDVSVSLNMTMMIFNQVMQTTRQFSDDIIKLHDEIQQFSNVTGIGIYETQKWRAAAIATDTDFSSLTTTMAYLETQMGDTSTTGDTFRKTLTDMGVTIRTASGDYVDGSTLLRNILTQIDQLPTAAEKDAAAKRIWGRSWSNLAEMINNAGTAIRAFDSASPGITSEDMARVDEYKKRWKELDDQIENAKLHTATAFFGPSKDATRNLYTGTSDIYGNRTGTFNGEEFMKTANANYAARQKDTGVGWAEDIFGGASEGKATTVIDNINSIADAMKEYKNAIDDVADAQQKLSDINKEYYRDLSTVDYRDVGAVRNLMTQHKYNVEDQTAGISAAQKAASAAGAGIGKAAGDLIVNIDSKTVAKIPGVITNTGADIAQSNRSMGVDVNL
jgi:hypothetical protein